MHWFVVVALALVPNFTGNNVSWGTRLLESEFFDCQYMICQNVKNYPEDIINEAMAQQHSLRSLLNGMVFNATSDMVISNRIRPFSEVKSSQLCNVQGPTTLRPRKMRNMKNELKMIVNTEKYRQIITVEACLQLASPNAATTREYCSDIFNNNCKQNFQPLSLLVYEKGKIRFDTFLIPAVCKCCGD